VCVCDRMASAAGRRRQGNGAHISHVSVTPVHTAPNTPAEVGGNGNDEDDYLMFLNTDDVVQPEASLPDVSHVAELQPDTASTTTMLELPGTTSTTEEVHMGRRRKHAHDADGGAEDDSRPVMQTVKRKRTTMPINKPPTGGPVHSETQGVNMNTGVPVSCRMRPAYFQPVGEDRGLLVDVAFTHTLVGTTSYNVCDSIIRVPAAILPKYVLSEGTVPSTVPLVTVTGADVVDETEKGKLWGSFLWYTGVIESKRDALGLGVNVDMLETHKDLYARSNVQASANVVAICYFVDQSFS
jgi:hypothetical protein